MSRIKTRRIKVDSKRPLPEQLQEAAATIRAGGIVAFPTETVYGLATNANMPEAVRRLRRLRHSPPRRPFTIHLSDIDDLVKHVPYMTPLGHRLIRHFWPGPLTIVARTGERKYKGVRLPDHPVARELIRLAQVTVIAPSANIAKHPPALTAREVEKTFKGKIEWIIDGGPSRYRKSSTVVRITDSGYKLQREGVIPERAIRELAYKQILFVCTGNSCRSPMAVAIASHLLARRINLPVDKLEQAGYRIVSAGTAGLSGGNATVQARTAVEELNCPMGKHQSQPLTIDLIEESDLIYVMTHSHHCTILEWAPQAEQRTKLLDPSGRDISDPIGSPLETYRQCARRIKSLVEKRLPEIMRKKP